MKILMLILLVMAEAVVSADVQWSRLNGTVKGVNGKTSQVVLQNKEGDLLTVKVDSDVIIMRGKDAIALKDVQMDQKVTLIYMPKMPEQKTSEEEPPQGGVYKPGR